MVMGDRDLNLKLRMQAILWRLGYYTRLNVKLASYSHPSRPGQREQIEFAELTDIDVLGIRFDADYTISYAVADCTTMRRISPVARTFWMRGVMDYFHADRGYEILARRLSAHERDVAAGLGITLLDESSLQALEERYLSDRTPLTIHLTDEKAFAYIEDNIAHVDSNLNSLLSYRKYGFWKNKPNRNLLNAISIVRRARDVLDPSQKFHRVLLLDLLALFSIALLEACSEMFRTNPDNLLESFRTYLFGGTLAMQAKESLLRDIKAFTEMQPALLPQEAINRLSLDPAYLRPLSEITQRFINKPSEARNVPRYLQAVVLERAALDGNPLRKIFIDEYSEVTFKFVHDLASFFKDATGVNPRLFQDLEKD